MEPSDIALRAAGALVVLAVAADVFATVLFPSSGHGLIRKPLARLTLRAWRVAIAGRHGDRRRRALAYLGPVQITVSIATWFGLLVLGWAMIFQPALGSGIESATPPTDTGWANALYYSGFSLTTLGVGDLAPTSAANRVLTIAAAAIGFAWFSLTVTYFLSVYSALPARNAFAQGLHQRTRRTDDGAELLVALARGDDLSAARDQLGATADFLRQTYQTHRSYPVLRYFHFRQPYAALPRILLTTLDTATLVRTALDPDRYDRLLASSDVDELVDSGQTLLDELVPDVDGSAPGDGDEARWRARFERAVDRLVSAGVAVRDTPQAADDYTALRRSWDPALRQLAERMLYEWDDIEPDPAPTRPVRTS